MREINISSPATIVDMADMAEAAHVTSRLQWQIVRLAWSTGESFCVRDAGGEIIGVAGLMPMAEAGCAEAWFQFRPEASRHMLAIIRAIRLTLARSQYRAIVTLCRTPEGARIARAAGFHFAEQTELGEVWGYGGTSRQPDRGIGAPGA